MKKGRMLSFVLLAFSISSFVVLGVLGKSHSSTLDDERSHFSEYGVEYDGYLFAPLNKEIVRIPLEIDKINGNAEFVMSFPKDAYGSDYYSEESLLIKNGGDLYINFADYMSHGGLFRMTSGSGKPEFILKTSNDAAFITITNSNRHPETLKFLRFSEGDADVLWGDLYGYLPHKNKVVELTYFRSKMKNGSFVEITIDDTVLISRLEGPGYETTHLEGLNRVTINPETGEVQTKRLLSDRNMPKTYFISASPNMEKLYLFGTGFAIYDVKSGLLDKLLEFDEVIENWPNDVTPYLEDLEYRNQKGKYIFVIDNSQPGHFYLLGDNKTVLIDALNETYERVEELKGDNDNLW